jgi:hypothetical protein
MFQTPVRDGAGFSFPDGVELDQAFDRTRVRQAPPTPDKPGRQHDLEVAMSTMTVSPTAFGGGRPVTVRLTRRGRLLLTLVLLVVAVAAAVLLTGGGSAAAGADPARGATATVVTVRPGETIWGIAERVAPGRDPRDTVQAILDLNGLQTSQVRVGTALRLP